MSHSQVPAGVVNRALKPRGVAVVVVVVFSSPEAVELVVLPSEGFEEEEEESVLGCGA